MPEEHSGIDGSELYTDLTPEEQEEAARNLERYLDIVQRIHERFINEGIGISLEEQALKDSE